MITVKLPYVSCDVDADSELFERNKEKFAGRENFTPEESREFEAPITISLNFGDVEGDCYRMEFSLSDARNIVGSLLQAMSDVGDPLAQILNETLAKVARK